MLLAETMIDLGRRAGREVICLLTDMDQPLGRAVGNALEIREALDTVRGEGPADFTELVLDACARLLALLRPRDRRRGGTPARRGGRCRRRRARDVRALDPSAGWRPGSSSAPGRTGPRSRCRRRGTGVVARVDALAVGIAALELGAGRRTKADTIDHAVGVVCFAKRGDTVLAGDDLAEVHARDEASAAAAAEAVLAAYVIADEAPPAQGILLDVVS